MKQLEKRVITGGPGGGKTTGINYIFEKLSNMGYAVVVVPEAATEIINNSGISPKELIESGRRNDYFLFQRQICMAQLFNEDRKYAPLLNIKQGRPLMICDRGFMDMRAYMTEEEFNTVLALENIELEDVREKRYGTVFHMVTVADGNEEFYTTENNPARYENAEEARKADQRTQKAWLGHSHLKVIASAVSFEKKLKKLLNAVQKSLKVPAVLEIEKKFKLGKNFDISSIPVPYVRIVIEQMYLPMQGQTESRIRRRTQNNSSVFYRTYKTPTHNPKTRQEREIQISMAEYNKLAVLRDETHGIIKKIRTCFVYRNQYFELDTLIEPAWNSGENFLELELTEENDKEILPPLAGKASGRRNRKPKI